MPSRKVGVIGATGTVGQRFIQLVDKHPWFELSAVAASERSAGSSYAEATTWNLDVPMPSGAADMEVQEAGADLDADIVFSAVPGGLAGPMEKAYADKGHAVFSNAKDNRRVDGIPLVIAEVNPEHFVMLDDRKGQGFVVTNGNCSGIVAILGLTPLHDAFRINQMHVVTMQAISGAGYPGVPSMAIMDNLIPFIGGEEDKVEHEPPHVWGSADANGKVTPLDVRISSTCTRVPVIEGHSMAVHMAFNERPSVESAADAIRSWRGKCAGLGLPSAPEQPVVLVDGDDAPQPRRARELAGGMAVAVGRLREDPLMHLKCFISGSNTVRGAAGQSLLNAEYAVTKGYC